MCIHFDLYVDAHAHVFASCAHFCVQIFTKSFWLFTTLLSAYISNFKKIRSSIAKIFAKLSDAFLLAAYV